MLKLRTSIVKEILILSRDVAGLAIIFIMPMVLIFVMALIQDSTFRKLDETRLSILFINEDLDSVGYAIEQGLRETEMIELHKAIGGKTLDRETMAALVTEGEYQIGIIVPEGTSHKLRLKANYLVDKALEEEGYPVPEPDISENDVILLFDPVISHSFRESVRGALGRLTYGIEARMIFDLFAEKMTELLGTDTEILYDPSGIIRLREMEAGSEYTATIPNSVQHNVPAWAVFAIFFILIPLTGNIIKERNSGSMLRLRLMPGSYWITITAKILVYLLISIIQFILMLLVGILILPLFGLPVLELGNHYFVILLMVVATGLAATAYGLALGAIAGTHEQAASFGSVSVIIFAALGGIWVPVFAMPHMMQKISIISPLNWGIEGFYTIFLRGGGLADILPWAGLLTGFALLAMLVAFYFLQLKKN